MSGMANVGAAGSAMTANFACNILGQCIQAECNTNHCCRDCKGPVHNTCSQDLRGVGEPSEFGFACGGDMCKLKMTEEEKAGAIRHRDVVRARAAAGEAGTEGPCSAGDNCVAKEGSQAIVTQCPHGNGRHFACARVACSPDCGEGGSEDEGDPKTAGNSDAWKNASALDNSGGDDIAAAATPTAARQRTSAEATSTSSRRTSGEGVGAGRTMRLRNKSSSTPSKQAATPSKAGSVVLPLEEIKFCIADALTHAFGDKKIVGTLVDKMAGTASQAKAMSAVMTAITANSREFITAAKEAGKEACAQYLKAPLTDLAKAQTDAANKWKDNSVEAATKWKTTAQALAKSSAQKSTPQVSDAKLTAAAKAGVMANNEALMTLVKTEVASQVLQLKTGLEARLTEMESSAKADQETRFGSLFTSIQSGLTNACEHITGVVKENGRQLDESISGNKRGPPSKTPSPKRRSPREHEATRRSDEREEATTHGALATVDGNTLMKIAAAMGTALSQGNANQARVSDQAHNNVMAQGTQSMGGFVSVPHNMMQARGAGASTMAMMQNQGAGASSMRMMPTQGAGASSMGMMPTQGAGGSSMGMGAPTQRMGTPSQGATNQSGYMQLFGQQNNDLNQGNGYPPFRFN
ncbi:hypothetical protein Esi_0055_0073 [Ectocarpus siliculosus]|uniref:Uncharacterized protein n=1 Tax=Ectocarpus siliculosus TaxID=2880 RepID=D7G494_ECTSI|nr:hypothetical protein Esi_0055_0073 [Ectocarpus siliculosus]|eukprot:CBJ27109.1 hypothetical protein Esi_0055_0073 [Ectocarpus siliculosus]